MSSVFVVRYQWDWLSPVAATQRYYWVAPDVPTEANPHFLGKFNASSHTYLPLLRQNSDSAPTLPTTGGAGIRVIIHDVQLPSRALASRLFYQAAALDVPPVVPQAETQPHFIGRFSAPIHTRLASSTLFHVDTGVRQPDATANIRVQLFDVPLPSLVRTSLLFYGQPSTDVQVAPAIETSISFIGRFAPTPYPNAALRSSLYLTTEGEDVSVVQPETNTNFLGRFKSPVHARFNFNSWDTSTPQVETNPHFIGRFSAPIYARFNFNQFDVPPTETNTNFLGYFNALVHRINPALRQSAALDIQVSSETNVSFIGRFAAPVHARFNFNSLDTGVPQTEQNVHFIGRFTPTSYPAIAITTALYTTSEGGDQTETNFHFIGRFKPTPYPSAALISALYLTNEAEDTGVVAQSETNTHFLGRFKPTVFARLPYIANDNAVQFEGAPQYFLGRFASTAYKVSVGLRQNVPTDTPPPQPETNTNFIARFAPSAYQISISLRQNAATDVPVVVSAGETNTHFIGKFTAPVHARLASSTLFNLDIASNLTNATGNIRVQLFDVPLPSLVRTSLLYYEQPAADATLQVEANPHFLGTFEGYTHSLLMGLRQNSSDVSFETNPHFLGRFVGTQHQISIALRQNEARDFIVTAVTETNTQWLGRFNPTAFRLLQYLWQNAAVDVPTVVQSETQPHFLGRFTAPVFARFNFNNWDTAVPQAETNVSFLGKFNALTHKVIPALRQHGSADFTETQPHMLGRFTASKHSILRGIYQNPALDVFAEQAGRDWIGTFKAQVHTIQLALRQTPNTDFVTSNIVQEPHFLGRFTPTSFQRFSFNNWDTGVPQSSESNPHFLGRYAPAAHKLLSILRQNDARDVQRETNVSFLGRFTAQVHVIQAALRQNPAQDLGPQAETNVHFLARYAALSHRILVTYRHAAGLDTGTFETNVNFLGRFTPIRHALLAGHRQNEARDIVQPETNVHFLGRYIAGAYTISVWLRQNPAQDTGRFETNTHFLGRFSSTTFQRFNFNTWDTQVPQSSESNPHFVGRHTPRQHTILSGLRQLPALDLFVETGPPNPHFIGRHSPALHRILAGYRMTVPTNPFVSVIPACINASVMPIWAIVDSITPAWMVADALNQVYRAESSVIGCDP